MPGLVLQGCNTPGTGEGTVSSLVAYDGAGLACIFPPPNPNLNQVILAIDAGLQNVKGRVTFIETTYARQVDLDALTAVVAALSSDDITWAGPSLPCINPSQSVNMTDIVNGIDAAICIMQGQIANPPPNGLGTVQNLVDDWVVTSGQYTVSNPGPPNPEIDFPVSGYVVTGVYFGVFATPNPINPTITLVDNRDNYIDISFTGPTYTNTAVPILDPAPGVVGMRLWKITVSGGVITGDEDFRNFYPLDGDEIADQAIEQRHIKPSSIGDQELIDTTVTPGTYLMPQLTVDQDGRLTDATAKVVMVAPVLNDLLIYDDIAGVFVNSAIDDILPSAFPNKFILHDGLSYVQSTALTELAAKVGIGVATPVVELDIAGALRLTTTATNGNGILRFDGSRFNGYQNSGFHVLMTETGGTVLPDHADAAAAVVAGLASGDYFKTGEIIKQVP